MVCSGGSYVVMLQFNFLLYLPCLLLLPLVISKIVFDSMLLHDIRYVADTFLTWKIILLLMLTIKKKF